MNASSHARMLHWGSALLVAIGVLAVTYPLDTTGASRGYRFTNSANKKVLFTATNVKPGQIGSKSVTLKNSGKKPIAVKVSQYAVTNNGFGSALQLRIFDKTRGRCVYPAKSKKGPCREWGSWNAGRRLLNTKLVSKKGKKKWPRREKHVLVVTWTLANASPNTDQGHAATMRLKWRASQ